MNTNNIKKYAPKARREFMDAVAKRLNTFGITANKKGELQIAEANLQGSVLQIAGNSFDGKLAEPRKRIVARSQKLGYAQLIEQVAYTWFNRLCAIRYMEIHDYLGHGFRVLSHPDNPKGFEIIDHAQDAADELGLDRSRIIELKLAGNKDEELYRELLLGQCHKLHEAMPFLFDALDDETELLLPDNLTRTDSILRGLVDGIPEEDWQQVEVIGWLYQFYISEKKDQVMGKVVKSEDIPAATQLFTPNWIVKYLVQNSVGRQWLQTYPDSAIKTQMEYYIEPAEQSDEVNQQLKAITPASIEPETIKVLDPACGSGHILIEAYNVLKAIYEERGFRSRDIPKMILENILYGLDIDDRAAQLSGFALMMMARDDDKRIFTRNVRLNVLSLQESNHIDLPTLWKALNLSGNWQSGTSQGLFSDDEQDLSSFNADNRYQLLKRTLARFIQAKTFGSLIDVPSDEYEQLKELLSTLVELQESGDSMQKPAAKQLIEIVHQALVLSIRYDAVIANPPYMGRKGMPQSLKGYISEFYPECIWDIYSAFIMKSRKMVLSSGRLAMITMHSRMFLSAFEELRKNILSKDTILSMLHLGTRAFKEIGGEVVQTCAFVIERENSNAVPCSFYDLQGYDNSDEKENAVLVGDAPLYNGLKDIDFKLLPSASICYWATKDLLSLFSEYPRIGIKTINKSLNLTGDNNRFLRFFWEIDSEEIGKDRKWIFYAKGGAYKKWYGNFDYVINWSQDAVSFYRSDRTARIIPENLWWKEGVTWTKVTTSAPGFRLLPKEANYDVGGSSILFDDIEQVHRCMGFLNTPLATYLIRLLITSVNIQVGDIEDLPDLSSKVNPKDVSRAIELSKTEWNMWESSFEFSGVKFEGKSFYESFKLFHEETTRIINELHTLENIISANVTKDLNVSIELRDVDLESISLESNCSLLELQSKWAAQLISYVIGCIMGRYSIINEGIMFASKKQNHFFEKVNEGAFSNFFPDDDGIIPLTDQEWFKDDATNRFREFVQVVSGEAHLQENLDFVAESLCLNAIKPKKSELALEAIRRYLSTQFYKDHLKTYKKRPIYWLFSSGKQKAFECLVYLHRYNEGTLSRMRTEYVTPLLGKYDAYAEQLEKQIETADSTIEANRFKKELDALIKKQVELREFDDKLKHYADMRISLDLDDGVKVNYGKFGDLLADVKAITGSAPEVN